MSIIKFDPARGFETMARRMHHIMNDFDRNFTVEYGCFSPRIDIAEDVNKLYLQVEIPGMTKEDVKLTINDENILVIKGEKKREVQTDENQGEKRFLKFERRFGEFTRSFALPENLNKETISAKYENGILNIEIEKIEPAKPKEINVSIN